ncbi:TetR/AcrR family transcriptional regulator [Paenibacillus hodogayensis]|uniref:TetR/AcrR family transcriptional regulator n=1 Tax=Paenibacillus hodogayensis TaxID=279208 RepID=A0ABV5W497_9BACL
MSRAGLDDRIVLEAALEITDRGGLEQLTLVAVAKKLGVRPPALYNHVNGLPDLRNKLMIDGLHRLKDELARATAGQTGDDAVWAASQAYLAFARKHPGLYEATQRPQHWQDGDVQEALRQLMDIIFRIVSPFGLDEEAAVHTVRGLRSLLHGFASLEGQGGFGMPLNVDESFRFVVYTFLAGIQSR